MWKIFKRLYSFILKRKWVYFLSLAIATVAFTLELAAPYFFKLFIEAIQKNDIKYLTTLIFVFAGVQFTELIFQNLKWFTADIVGVDTAIDIRAKVFRYVQDLDFSFHTGKSTGSLISAFKRGDNAFWSIFDKINHNLWQILIGFIVMGYFFIKIDPKFIIIFVVSMALTLLATKYLAGKNISTREEFNEWDDKVSGIVTDNLINFETVKLFAREDYEQMRLKNTFVDWKSHLWKHFITYRMIDLSVGSLVNFSILTVLVFATSLLSKSQISVGDFVLIVGYVNVFFPKLFDLIYSIKDISVSYADLKKYLELLDYEIEVKDPSNPIVMTEVVGNVEFNNVEFRYKNRSKNAINNFSLKINKGQAIALVGRSGSGKTTLSKLLMRFYDINSGEIKIDGININEFAKSTLRSFIGVVPQEPILFNNTIGYNIGYGKNNPKFAEIRSAAKIANIDEFIQGLPKKYETEVGERGVKLSGGQKQRLAIARMILSDPDIVVFDEATSHLDSESEKLIQDAFWKARAGKTTIIIAHRLSTIMRADKIVVMEHGKIKEIGTHNELTKRKGSLYSHFWNLQIKLD